MRHEIRDSESLHFTMEVIIGGTPTSGLAPKIRIYSINNDEYWQFTSGGAPSNVWVTNADYVSSPSDCEGDMGELQADGLPGVYDFNASVSGVGIFWSNSVATTSPDSADEGYVIRMEESTSGFLEYIHVVVSDVMVSSTSFSGAIDANVVQWEGNNVTATTTNGVPNVNVVEWDGSGVSGSGGIPDVDVVSSITVDANVVDWNNLGPYADPGNTTGVILSADSTTHFPNVDAASGGTISANVVDWGGLNPSLSVGSSTSFPVISVGGWRDGSSATDAETALGSSSGLPSINVEAWNDNTGSVTVRTSGANLSVGLPAVTVEGWGGDGDAAFSIGDTSKAPEISVRAWNTSDGNASHADAYVQTSAGGDAVSGDSLPMISVGGWGGDSDASFTVGNTSAVPEISVKAWNTTNNATTPTSADAYVFSAPGGSEYDHSVNTVLLPAITVKGWAGVSDAAVSVGTTNRFPRISVKTWEGAGTSVTGGSPTSPDDILVTWTQDYLPDGNSVVRRPNIRTQIIANNAIDEDAIQVDSVTYEEISATAAQEISDAVWNADIFNTIYNPHTGTAAPPNTNTMAEAMIIRYLSENMNHWTGGGTPVGTPVHTCNNADPNGQKFYSNRLLAHPLTEAEMISYVDRSIVVKKGFDLGTMSFDQDTQSYLGRIVSVGEEEGSGTQYFEIKLVNEDESSVPSPGLEASDVLIVKAETDSTMHEIAHEVWEEEVADHETKHTFGMFNRIIAGLAQYNHRITDSIYDETGRLLACRLVVYASAEDADAALPDTALTTVVVTSEYDEKQNMTKFLSKEEGAYADVDPDPEDSNQ